MTFFMNPFNQEYKALFPQVDHHDFPKPLITYTIPPNKNTSTAMVAWNVEPYDFSSLTDLTINYAIDSSLHFFASLVIDVSGATAGATTAKEVVDALNANATFADLFSAKVQNVRERSESEPTKTVLIKSKKPQEGIKVYISNSGAESKLRFNKYAGIAEIPSYFSKDIISNYYNANSAGQLIKLDGTDTAIDRPIIREFLDNSSWTNSDLKEDWQLLKGRGGRFKFTINTVNDDGQPTETIEWSAGAVAGDLGVKIIRVWGGATDTVPEKEYYIPYVLQSNDVANVPT